MDWLTPRLRAAYRRTAYVVSDAASPMVLMVNQTNQAAAALLQARGLKSAFFLSAHNPWGMSLSAQDNRQRHAALRQMLQDWPLLEGFGVSPQGEWPAETSVLVLCDDPDLQEQWLQRFEQNAAVRVTADGEVELVFNRQRPAVLPEASTSAQVFEEPFAEFPPHQRLCFYPSSGTGLLWAVMQLDCDLFVFVDKDRRHNSWAKVREDFSAHRQPLELLVCGTDFVLFRSRGKTGLLLWQDNNEVLEQLRDAGLQVHHFVGICDGCGEGGNYECVHERPFVRRLLRVATNGMGYTTDHSRPLQESSHLTGWGMFHTRKFMAHVTLEDFPEPPHWRRSARWPELSGDEGYGARFELEGVLVQPNDALRHLTVLHKGPTEATQLDVLQPYRTLAKRSILAEYRVWLQPDTEAQKRLPL